MSSVSKVSSVSSVSSLSSVSSNAEIAIVRNRENEAIEINSSAVEDSSENESNTLENENFDIMSEKCDRRQSVVKLQKIERITFSTLNNYQCENCNEDSLNFHQHVQKMHTMPVILYCKNCNDYKIVQTFNEIESFFEEHECNSPTSNSQIEPVPSVSSTKSTNLPKILNVKCKNLSANLDTSKFISGGNGNCIQLGKDL